MGESIETYPISILIKSADEKRKLERKEQKNKPIFDGGKGGREIRAGKIEESLSKGLEKTEIEKEETEKKEEETKETEETEKKECEDGRSVCFGSSSSQISSEKKK